VVASVVPSIGNSAGGLAVTVTGSNFGVGDYDPTVLVGATACSRTLYVSDAKLVCVTPPGGGADVGVSVSVAHQQGQVLPSAFGYASPTILRIYPDSGPITGNTHVTITGTNFGRSAASMPKAYVGKRPCAKTTWVSNQMVLCETPRGADAFKRHPVTVDVEGVFTPALSSARYIYVKTPGSKQEGFFNPRGGQRAGKLSASRAPGMYLSIAYLVAFAIIMATMCILRMLLLRKSSSSRRSVRKVQRGFFGRATNKLFGWILRTSDEGGAESSVYHIVDSIDIEMEASSEIDMVEHLRPLDR